MQPPHPKPGEKWYGLVKFFVNNINWCDGFYYHSNIPKPDNKLYNFFYTHWLFPFDQNDCICCNTVRGLIYGFIIGSLIW